MSEKTRWEIPSAQQPRPDEVGFDLSLALRSIVSLHAQIPEDGFTAQTLGSERTGSGSSFPSPGWCSPSATSSPRLRTCG